MSTSDDELAISLAEVTRRFPALSAHLLRPYVEEILRWNAQLGLVSKKNPVAACQRLLMESAEFGDLVARVLSPAPPPHVADVGSGAGFPGVVWRLLYPNWDLVLIERREKKAVFLEQVVKRLRLARTEVVAADARDTSRLERFRGGFDAVATMAVGDPSRTAAQIEDLLVPAGIYATTLAAGAVAPDRCGARLFLESDTRAHFGRYATYRKRV